MKNRLRAGGPASLFVLILLISFLATFGCGGGGGGGGGGGVEYTGVTTQATVNDTNADALATGAYDGGTAGSSMTPIFGAVNQGGVNDLSRYVSLTRTLKDAISQVDVYAPEGIVEAGAIVQESGPLDGDCGGSGSYVISFNDQTGDFTGTFSFSALCSGGVTMSGSATFSGTFDEGAGEFVEFTITTSGFTAVSGADSFTLSGSITFNFQASPAIVSADLKLRDNVTEEVCWAHNYMMTVVEGSGYEDITFTGTFYHPDHGYVVVSTQIDIRIGDFDTYPSQGVLVVTGAGGSKARLTAGPIGQYQVEVDADGDDTYEDDFGLLDW